MTLFDFFFASSDVSRLLSSHTIDYHIGLTSPYFNLFMH